PEEPDAAARPEPLASPTLEMETPPSARAEPPPPHAVAPPTAGRARRAAWLAVPALFGIIGVSAAVALLAGGPEERPPTRARATPPITAPAAPDSVAGSDSIAVADSRPRRP